MSSFKTWFQQQDEIVQRYVKHVWELVKGNPVTVEQFEQQVLANKERFVRQARKQAAWKASLAVSSD